MINDSFFAQGNSSWGNSGMVNPDVDSWFDIGTGTNNGQWPGGGVGPVIPGGQGSSGCGTQQGWPYYPGQGNCSCGSDQGWSCYPSQGPGPVQPGWPGCSSNTICVTSQELSHIIENILQSSCCGNCCVNSCCNNSLCCANNGCLGYAPKNNCCCGYNGYKYNNCNKGYNYGNYSYSNYSYGSYDCDSSIWWLIIIFFFFGGFCFI